jgi:murein L,D-transpeptidase YcbB/YkuD
MLFQFLSFSLLVIVVFTTSAQSDDQCRTERKVSAYYHATYYNALTDALLHYQSVNIEDWKYISIVNIKEDSSEFIFYMQQRLQLLGDLPTEYLKGKLDLITIKAIIQFRERHGLDTVELINKDLIKYLNIDLYSINKKIISNINRYMSNEAIYDSTYIIMNIPEQKLKLIENDSVVLEMKVVIGKRSTPTPGLHSKITHIILNPEWNIPASIIQNEILPKQKKDSTYLIRNQMVVNECSNNIRITQKPGPVNALGKVKFIFENEHSIYLHDTPYKSLFRKQNRAYSHGCIRLENPLELATYLLEGDTNWKTLLFQEGDIDIVPKTIYFKKAMPIHIVYFTSWVDQNGLLHFRNDIYNKNIEEKDI